METVDFILNLAGVLLWVNWIMTPASPSLGTPTTLLGTLRRAEQTHFWRWYFLAALPVLITIRAWIYWEVGGSTAWIPQLHFGTVSVALRCDYFQRAFCFSLFSFALTLALFYLWLVLLSALNRRPANPDPFGRFVRMMLGPVVRRSWGVQLILPLLAIIPLWVGLSALFEWMRVVPPPESLMHRIEQGVLIALGAYLTWSHLLAGLLLLYVVSTYVHLGDHPLWAYVNTLSRTFLTPFRTVPLRVGKVDFTPLVALALVYLGARGAEHLLLLLNRRLPL